MPYLRSHFPSSCPLLLASVLASACASSQSEPDLNTDLGLDSLLASETVTAKDDQNTPSNQAVQQAGAIQFQDALVVATGTTAQGTGSASFDIDYAVEPIQGASSNAGATLDGNTLYVAASVPLDNFPIPRTAYVQFTLPASQVLPGAVLDVAPQQVVYVEAGDDDIAFLLVNTGGVVEVDSGIGAEGESLSLRFLGDFEVSGQTGAAKAGLLFEKTFQWLPENSVDVVCGSALAGQESAFAFSPSDSGLSAGNASLSAGWVEYPFQISGAIKNFAGIDWGYPMTQVEGAPIGQLFSYAYVNEAGPSGTAETFRYFEVDGSTWGPGFSVTMERRFRVGGVDPNPPLFSYLPSKGVPSDIDDFDCVATYRATLLP